MDTVGNRIAFARKRADMRQQDLGDKIGVSRVTVVNWETGRTKCPPVALKEIAKIAEVSYEWLISGEEIGGGMAKDEELLLSYYRQLDGETKLEAITTLHELCDVFRRK